MNSTMNNKPPFPNEQHFPMTDQEWLERSQEALKLFSEGDDENGLKALKTLPMSAELAQVGKKRLGLEEIRTANCYEAIVKWGPEWLEK
ncbi:MAG: hypothetical protein ACRCTY_01860 [Candidatus Adiutrix sp.]